MAKTDDGHREVGIDHPVDMKQHPLPWSCFSHYFCVFSSALVCMIGLTAIIGWHTKTDALIQVHPDFAPLQYNAALCFIACGIALLLNRYNQRKPSTLVATAALVLSGLVTLEHFLGYDIFEIDHLFNVPHIDTRSSAPGRMSLFTCVSFILSCAAIISSGLYHRQRNTSVITATFSSMVIAISLLGATGYTAGLTGASSWTYISQMSLLTVIGFMLLGAGSLACAWSDHVHLHQQSPIWLPTAIFASTLTTTILLGGALYKQEALNIQRTATDNALVITTALSSELADRHSSIRRMALRATPPESPNKNSWVNDAHQYILADKGYQFIAITDATFKPTWIVPDPEFQGLLPDLIPPDGWAFTHQLEHLNLWGGVTTIPSSTQKNEIDIIAAIQQGDSLTGLVVAAIDSENFFNDMLPEKVAAGHHFTVTCDSHLLYQRGESAPTAEHDWVATEQFNMYGANWTVTLWPAPQTLKNEHIFYSKVVIGLGFLASVLLGLTCYLLQIASRKSEEAATHNTSLQHEINEHIRSREKLGKASSLNNAIVTHSAYAVITTDVHGIITSFNPAAERLLGYTAVELIGKHTPDVFHDPDEIAAHAKELSKKYNTHISPGFEAFVHEARTGIDRQHEWTYIHRDGTRIPVSLGITSISNSQQEIIGFVGVSNDITELKQTVTKLRQTHEKLMATTLQVGRAEVATNILHNVGNVLNSINITSTMLGERIRNSRTQSLNKTSELLDEHAETLTDFVSTDRRGQQLPAFIRKLSDRLTDEQQQSLADISQLTQDINHLRAIIAAQQSISKVSDISEPVPVADLIDTALKIHNSSLPQGNTLITVDCPGSQVAHVERHKVVQILINLISNAKHACQESHIGNPKITIAVHSDDQQCRISITDNGIGIHQENINRIFTHGFTTKPHGHGFGLHSSAIAASEMKGSLHVFSAGPAKGATFTLSLPSAHTHTST